MLQGTRGKSRLSPGWLRSLTVTLGDAGANPLVDIRLYGLRHTFATLMFENSEQLKLVSEMLGHAHQGDSPSRPSCGCRCRQASLRCSPLRFVSAWRSSSSCRWTRINQCANSLRRASRRLSSLRAPGSPRITLSDSPSRL